MTVVETVSWAVAFVVTTIIVTGAVGKLGWPAPVMLVIVGAAISLIPAVPEVQLEPDLILYGVLPPLLFAAAIRTSIVDVRARQDSIGLLSVGLVAFTVVTVGIATSALIPAIPLAAAFAFAAVVAPTDAVAVTAVAGRLNLPRRVVTILEGESLLNDATALVALNASILAFTTTVRPLAIGAEFVIAVGVGIGIGFVIGWIVSSLRVRLRSAVLDTSITLVTPFAAFLGAQILHGSGVLAVVTAGLFLAYRAPIAASAEARVAELLNWRTIQFLLENAVFLFIGLSLKTVLSAAMRDGVNSWQTAIVCAGILAALVTSRFAWVMGTTMLYRRGPRRLRERSWSWQSGVVVSVAGVRGVVTLAAAFVLPPGFAHREYLQLLAFLVVSASLLGALALPPIIRALRLPAPNSEQESTERQLLLAEARQAGLRALDEEAIAEEDLMAAEALRTSARVLSDTIDRFGVVDATAHIDAQLRLRLVMLAAERAAVLDARSSGLYQEPAVASALRAIDAEEAALRAQIP